MKALACGLLRLRVKLGGRAQAGQVLVELDSAIASADIASVQEPLKTRALDALRTRELLQLLSKKKLLAPVLLAQTPHLAAKKTALAPAAPGEGLALPEVTTLSNPVPAHPTGGPAAQSCLRETQQAKAAYKTETLRTLSDRHAQASARYSQLQSDATKASQREKQTQLTAPVAGTIQQLAIHSVGGVVTSAQPLMIVVPDSPTVSAEVSIANQDIGFVNAGQMAEVKLETFPYTQYGTVQAKVDVVTADAVTDEKKGSYYPATLTLSQRDMLIDGKRVNLSPGMNITAEIKTGKRRIIEYLLSPVQRAGSESLRER